VERIFSSGHPDPQEVEKANKVLKVIETQLSSSCLYSQIYCTRILTFLLLQEHEQALLDAISRLGEYSDGESGMILWKMVFHFFLILGIVINLFGFGDFPMTFPSLESSFFVSLLFL